MANLSRANLAGLGLIVAGSLLLLGRGTLVRFAIEWNAWLVRHPGMSAALLLLFCGFGVVMGLQEFRPDRRAGVVIVCFSLLLLACYQHLLAWGAQRDRVWRSDPFWVESSRLIVCIPAILFIAVGLTLLVLAWRASHS